MLGPAHFDRPGGCGPSAWLPRRVRRHLPWGSRCPPGFGRRRRVFLGPLPRRFGRRRFGRRGSGTRAGARGARCRVHALLGAFALCRTLGVLALHVTPREGEHLRAPHGIVSQGTRDATRCGPHPQFLAGKKSLGYPIAAPGWAPSRLSGCRVSLRRPPWPLPPKSTTRPNRSRVAMPWALRAAGE